MGLRAVGSSGGGGGSASFTNITNGTNIAAAMIVGTGASLVPNGSGDIVATRPITQLLATRCGINQSIQFNTGQPGVACRTQHYLPYGAKSLYPVYSAFYMAGATPAETAEPGGFGFYATAATVVAGGTGYAVGDFITVSGVATNQFAPTLQVMAVSGGVVTSLSVLDGGGFGAQPSTGLTTTKTTGGGDNALTVTLSTSPCAFVINAAIEQVWGTQTAASATNLTGVVKNIGGLNQTLGLGNIPVPYATPAISAPSLVGLAIGTTIGMRIYTPGTGFYAGRYIRGVLTLNEFTGSNINLSSAQPYGGTYPTVSGAVLAFQPIALMGIPQVPGPSFAIIGDSITYGTISSGHDAMDANGNSGYIERAINQICPFTNFSTGGDELSLWLGQTQAAVRLNLLQQLNISHVVEELGINDLRTGTTYATFAAQKIKFWQLLKGMGIKEIWATTITMNTTSTKGLSVIPTIANGGTGYALSSTFNVTIAGGTQTLGAAVVSVSTNGSGVVTTVNSIVNIGYYTVNPATTNSPMGGTGTGLSLTLTLVGWLDTTSQTLTSTNTAIQSYNSDLRNGVYNTYIANVLDLGTSAESTVGSGLWPGGATTDGLHPTQNQTAVMAAQIATAFPLATL